jgi:hypothetical protein
MRTVAAAAITACAALGFAVPAQADDPPPNPEVLEGVFDYLENGQKIGTWQIYPTCVPTVGDLREPLYLPVACHLHVSPSEDVTGGDAVMTNGLWTFQTPEREGLECPDGSRKPTNEVLSFDPIALTGTRKIFNNAECGLQPAMKVIPFNLVYTGPLPIPVDRYPLICEPGGLRRCF